MAAAGTTDPVIGPVDVPVVAGQVTIAYAIGSLEDDTLGAVVQTIQVGEQEAPLPARCSSSSGQAPMPVPSGVPAGDSGLAADAGSSFPAEAALAAVAVALAGAGISARSLTAARRRS